MSDRPRGASSADGAGTGNSSPPRAARALKVAGAGLTDVGRQRRHNEDHILVRPDLGLFVVADGMGGHNAGNVASALVTTSIENFFAATETDPLPPPKAEDAGLAEGARRLALAVRKANRDVFEISSTHQQHHGMGSTIVAMHIPRGGDEVHIAHVGDSRCYRVRQGEIQQLTRDHSLINDALEIKPDLTEADLARLPKNIITRALGMKDAVKVDLRTEKMAADDLYLLCSDGLSGMVSDADLGDVLGMSEHVADACEVLVAMANDAGGTDNISAVVVRVSAAERPSLPAGAGRTPSIFPRSAPPPADLEIAVGETEVDEDVFTDGVESTDDIDRLVSVTPPPVQGAEALAPEEQDIGALAEMLDDESPLDGDAGDETDEPERLTIPFDMPAARCRSCRADLLIGARFCVQCGEPMSLSA